MESCSAVQVANIAGTHSLPHRIRQISGCDSQITLTRVSDCTLARRSFAHAINGDGALREGYLGEDILT